MEAIPTSLKMALNSAMNHTQLKLAIRGVTRAGVARRMSSGAVVRRANSAVLGRLPRGHPLRR